MTHHPNCHCDGTRWTFDIIFLVNEAQIMEKHHWFNLNSHQDHVMIIFVLWFLSVTRLSWVCSVGLPNALVIIWMVRWEFSWFQVTSSCQQTCDTRDVSLWKLAVSSIKKHGTHVHPCQYFLGVFGHIMSSSIFFNTAYRL